MEPVYYTVETINGDYAYLRSDGGVENQVAMFLLPEGTDVGVRLLWPGLRPAASAGSGLGAGQPAQALYGKHHEDAS